ncbi:metallophosphoesterase family protein [Massilia cavernae]|uniref:Metallophosphoesterase n=1 Tax=Massilia cavernae TaxID=2320864 RepID=A0A418XFR5_9BURK|nr:metallophosphoesterase family protein [Massilia cavernae]RJG11302.1 metallophosphoesterase [Massilia cavernae]
MRLALLTDLHANREALDACLAHARVRGADRYAFTGDLVGYGADPEAVIDTVMDHVARGAVAVRGNHDQAVSVPSRSGMHAEAREVIDWTRARLKPGQLAFLDALPLTSELGNMMFVHASAHQPEKWEYVTGLEEAERSLRASRSRMVFSGHVHAPSLYRRADDGRMGSHTPRDGMKVRIAPQHQYLVIPGSVGQPRDGNCAACYAMFDDEKRELSYFRVPYDHGAAARRVIAEGLPIVFAMRLVEGI